MSAARTEKSKPSDTSFNAGVNPVLDKKAYLEEKAQWEQALEAIPIPACSEMMKFYQWLVRFKPGPQGVSRVEQ